ncbi:MAG: hypothetical protein IKU88_06035 [Alistipes sp.]|nr:hypothetical protein [Alistipes sp.]
MKKKIFMACAALVVSAAAVVGVKAYDHLQMTDLALANIEALAQYEMSEGFKIECRERENNMCVVRCAACRSRWISQIDIQDKYAASVNVVKGCDRCASPSVIFNK